MVESACEMSYFNIKKKKKGQITKPWWSSDDFGSSVPKVVIMLSIQYWG